MTNAQVTQLSWATPRLALGAGLLSAIQEEVTATLREDPSTVRTRERLRPFPHRSVREDTWTLFPPESFVPARKGPTRHPGGDAHNLTQAITSKQTTNLEQK